jgi:hypothetical protein
VAQTGSVIEVVKRKAAEAAIVQRASPKVAKKAAPASSVTKGVKRKAAEAAVVETAAVPKKASKTVASTKNTKVAPTPQSSVISGKAVGAKASKTLPVKSKGKGSKR